tara:strand:+ start:356 stop:937 length:582 start_codon:yes stop_codon:yes gene_type:complete
MSEVNHEIKSWGPQFFIETGNEVVGYPGRTVYFMGAKTKDGAHVYNQSFHEDSGLSRVYTEKTLQVECGIHNSESDNSYRFITHRGSYAVNADRGQIKLKAKDIILEAADSIYLKADNLIQIGHPGQLTDRVQIEARKVQISGRGGNMGNALKTSNIFRSFATSFAGDNNLLAAGASMIGGPVAGFAVKTFFG